MDGSRFDRLVRFVAEDGSRRGLLRSTFVATLAGFGLTSVLGVEESEAAKSCKKKCKKKDNKNARKKCKKKCNKQTPTTGKSAGTLCDASSECTSPFVCALPLNDSGGDKRCCGQTGAPCGGDNNDLDDQPPICCQGFICSTDGKGTSTPGTCQLVK